MPTQDHENDLGWAFSRVRSARLQFLSMKISKVNEANKEVYLNLAQAYEAEFSSITRKKPDQFGKFSLDTKLNDNNIGFILYFDSSPAGISAITQKGNSKYEIAEFYVVPYFRGANLGRRFAHGILEGMKGYWEIKQISGAEYATLFWRKVLSSYVGNDYVEDQYEDPYWGLVTRQSFNNTKMA